MDKDIITVKEFSVDDNIDEIIEIWALNSGFKESRLPKQIKCDDAVYCFSIDQSDSKTLLTISILDGIAHLETWTIKSIMNNNLLKKLINNLLLTLGQNPIK